MQYRCLSYSSLNKCIQLVVYTNDLLISNGEFLGRQVAADLPGKSIVLGNKRMLRTS